MKKTQCLPQRLALAVSMAFTATGIYAQTDATYPTIPLLGVQDVTVGCKQHIQNYHNDVKQLEQTKNNTSWFAMWDKFNAKQQDFMGPVEILSQVSPDATLRQHAEDCIVEYTKFTTDLYQNEIIYQKFKQSAPRDAIDTKFKQDNLESFEDTGVGLSTEKKVQLKNILEQLTQLSQEYDRNVRENKTKLEFTADQLKGLPESYITNLKKNAAGHYLLGFEYPEYNPFMQLADDDQARQKYYYEFTRRGTEKNLAILKNIMDLRYQMAQIFGYPSYADWATKNRMAKDSKTVNQFLANVKNFVTPLQQQTLDQLQAFKAKTLNIPLSDAKIQPWSTSYWGEKYRKANYQVDQEQLRQYFPTEASQAWLLAITSHLYGMRFEQAQVPVWQKEVRYFNVFDAKTNQFLGGLYIDPFPREGKYGHAAVWPIYGSSTLTKRTPIAVLVTNFNRKGLNADELETFVHEFGHAMHNILSKTRYVGQAGTSVERDFVEAPSQMYEEWAKNLQPLSQLSHYCSPACPTVDQALVTRLNAAKNYGASIQYARQTLYAQYDMSIHAADALQKDPMTVWKNMETQTSLGYMDGTEFPGQFGHLVSGYGAGYYGYMWSQVIALDMLSAYKGNLMDSQVGQRYRQTILSQGSQKPATELIKDFLKRPTNNTAFYQEIGGQRLK
ncbi:thimet oligopeptidase [Acinetobacter boissieri]|uniref:Thimet oligopeptidase n=2 Tax=Acinetobacter boissieri TaxID=1219383 RepID=A0A1G6H0X4_9GAMM|nr:thimet oligopeptidase [Acinetobacter boissieri]